MLTIKIASNEVIKGYRETWNNLVKSMEYPSIFLTWEWITTWLDHFGKNYKPIILFISDENDIVAIVPLAQRIFRAKNGFLNARVVCFCGSMELYPDHLEIICSSENSKNANVYINKMIEFFKNDYTQWDILHLRFLAGDGHLSSWLISAPEKQKTKLLHRSIAPYISLKGNININDFLQRYHHQKRYNLKKGTRILFKTKNIVMKRIETIDELKNGLEDLFSLHTVRAHEKGIISTFKGEVIIEFHRVLSKKFLEKGWLRLYFLMNGAKAISAVYGFIFGKKFYYYQTGLDPEWQKYGAGKILILKIIEDNIDEGMLEFDFLMGNEDYKSFWTQDYRAMLTFNIYNKNIGGAIEYWAITTKQILKSILKKTFFLKERVN